MLLARRFGERLLNLQRQGRIGTFPPIKGQEAAHLGAGAVLQPGDWFVPAFRETAAELWHGCKGLPGGPRPDSRHTGNRRSSAV